MALTNLRNGVLRQEGHMSSLENGVRSEQARPQGTTTESSDQKKATDGSILPFVILGGGAFMTVAWIAALLSLLLYLIGLL